MRIIKFTAFIIAIIATMSMSMANKPKININGTYVMRIARGQPIWVLHIEGDKYEILRKRNGIPVFLSDTISKGAVMLDKSNFIILSSEDLYDKASRSIKYKEYKDDTITDSIKITFYTPDEKYNGYYLASTKIHVFFSDFSFDLDTDSTTLTIPKRTECIDYFKKMHQDEELLFAITPIDNLDAFMPTKWLYVAFNSYTNPFVFKNKESNVVEIEIPDLKPDYFTRYVIHDEYCKVTPTSLTWRGMVFEKVSNQIIDLDTAQIRFHKK